jgi:hypothetical protein
LMRQPCVSHNWRKRIERVYLGGQAVTVLRGELVE